MSAATPKNSFRGVHQCHVDDGRPCRDGAELSENATGAMSLARVATCNLNQWAMDLAVRAHIPRSRA